MALLEPSACGFVRGGGLCEEDETGDLDVEAVRRKHAAATRAALEPTAGAGTRIVLAGATGDAQPAGGLVDRDERVVFKYDRGIHE